MVLLLGIFDRMAVKPFLLLGAILPASSPTHGLIVSHGLASESIPFASVTKV